LNDQNNVLLAQLKGLETMITLPTPQANIRKVHVSEFDPYLRNLGDVYEKHQLNRAMGLGAATEGMPSLDRKKTAKETAMPGDQRPEDPESGASFTTLEEWTARLAMAGSTAASNLPPIRLFSSPGKSAPPPATASAQSSNGKSAGPLTLAKTRMHSGNVPPLSTIPSMYFDPNFDLGNPHTFSAVCEYSDVTGLNSNDSAATQRILQEKLSHYLDIVEVHLIKEISTRSSSFFTALANLQSLHQETQACVDRITELRTRLKRLSDASIQKGLKIVRLTRMRGNMDLFHAGRGLFLAGRFVGLWYSINKNSHSTGLGSETNATHDSSFIKRGRLCRSFRTHRVCWKVSSRSKFRTFGR
jgi:hypothetical protein